MIKKIIISLLFVISFSFVFAKPVFDFDAKVIKVYDWDTIWVKFHNKKIKIRILGIDTPEIYHWQKIKLYKNYWCANQAKNFAIKYLLWKEVKVYHDSLAKNRWKYNRLLRYIYIPVKVGNTKKYIPYGSLALYYWFAKVYKWENFSLKSNYFKLENIAKYKKIWIWSNKCIQEDIKIKKNYMKRIIKHKRKYKKNTKSYKKQQKYHKTYSCWYPYHKKWCDIKWNINSRKVKIYHLPWRRFYNLTKITPSKWERWFCSEKQALFCGWRASHIK